MYTAGTAYEANLNKLLAPVHGHCVLLLAKAHHFEA